MNDGRDEIDPTKRFSSRARHYAKYRPDYPVAIIKLLTGDVGLTPASIVADIGSGTGILSELFLRNGNVVFGVEPNREMRAAAERLLGGWPAFHSIDGMAEATTLADDSVDGVVAGQAFHWFDSKRAVLEFKRIARPGGFVALVWNERRNDASAFMADYERLVRTFGSERDPLPFDVLKAMFGQNLRRATFPHAQQLDRQGLLGRLLSSSYLPLPGHISYEQMISGSHDMFDRNQLQGLVTIQYETRVFFGPLM